MDQEARIQKLEEAVKRFEAEVERLKAEHAAAINAILQDIKNRRLVSMKKQIEQYVR